MATLTTPDGVTLYYEDSGTGAPVVFVHEFGGDYRSWYRQVPAESKRFRCITYSARGFDPSGTPAQRSRYGQCYATADLLALVDHLSLDKVHLVGTSMGSFTSLDFALEHRDRVRSVTLVGNSSGPRDAAERQRYRSDWVGYEIALRERDGGDGAVQVLADDPAYQSFQRRDPSGWATYADHLRQQRVDGAVHILSTLHWDRRSLFDDRARLQALEVPVLLVTGKEDYYLVEETNAFHQATLPEASWHQFDETGHLVNIERAEAFNTLLLQHLDRASG